MTNRRYISDLPDFLAQDEQPFGEDVVPFFVTLPLQFSVQSDVRVLSHDFFVVLLFIVHLTDSKYVFLRAYHTRFVAKKIAKVYNKIMRTTAAVRSKKGKAKRLYTKDIAYIALCTSLIAVCAWVTVPSAVPFTLQTFAVFLTLGLLGGKRGTIAVLCYILLGAFGVPVFSSFRGGIGVLSGVTGGYIVGFLFSALVYWGIAALTKNKFLWKGVAFFVGLIVCYAFGTAWFVFVKGRTGSPVDFVGALTLCVVPFIAFDVAKLFLALFLTRILTTRLHLDNK